MGIPPVTTTDFRINPKHYRYNPDVNHTAIQYDEDNLLQVILFVGPERFSRYTDGDIQVREFTINEAGYLPRKWVKVNPSDWIVHTFKDGIHRLMVWDNTNFIRMFCPLEDEGTGVVIDDIVPTLSH